METLIMINKAEAKNASHINNARGIDARVWFKAERCWNCEPAASQKRGIFGIAGWLKRRGTHKAAKEGLRAAAAQR